VSTGEARRHQLLGLLVVILTALLVAVVVGAYRKAFTPVVTATVDAPRSGLLMTKGAVVALRGVNVGEVRAVRPDADGAHALLDIALDARQVPHIPANVLAEIVAPTLLAGKYVQLRLPARPTPARIADGARIPTTSVATEINSALDNLNQLLANVDVANLSTALGGLSAALQSHGKRLGGLLVLLNTDLRTLNPHVATLATDLTVGGEVSDVFRRAAPDLVRTAGNISVTSATLVAEKAVLPPLLARLIHVADNGQTLLARNGNTLIDLLATLRPTAALLAKYAPALPCTFAGLNQVRRDLENSIGGQYPGVHTFTSILPGAQSYLYPRDLPRIGANTPPSCFGGPISPAQAPFPAVLFPDGWHGFVRSDQITLNARSPLPNPLPRPLPHRALPTGTDAPAPAIPLPGDQAGHGPGHTRPSQSDRFGPHGSPPGPPPLSGLVGARGR